MINIKDYGATGKADQLCTKIIQQEIDRGAARGGETICFPAGIYLTGTIHLKSNITLHLENGAVLLGSPDQKDYNADDFCVQNRVFSRERVSGAHLIAAVEVENVAITGMGRIDGNRKEFSNRSQAENPNLFEYPEWRPAQMLFFCECRNVSIENVQLYNSTYWTCFLHGCEDVTVSGVRIWNDQRTWNGDGIDIDCCRRVVVNNCIIDSGDDCITLRGYLAPLKNQQACCQYITISNCILRTQRCNAFRIGVGDGVIRDCVISNCVVRDSRTGICIISRYSPQSPGVRIENILFENLYLECKRPLLVSSDVRGCQPESAKLIKGVSFKHLRGSGIWGCLLSGNQDCMISDIDFSHVNFEYSGGSDIQELSESQKSYGEFACKAPPAAFYLLNAKQVRCNHVRITWKNTDGPWQSALQAKNIDGLQICNCEFTAPANGLATDIQ